jgi:quercetin dioxygenase-like cupin family protein
MHAAPRVGRSHLPALGCVDRHVQGILRRVAYRVVDTRALEGRRKLVAQELGARAIKLSRFDNEPGQPGREHDERRSRQEEIYLAVTGAGHMVVDGEQVTLEPGVFVLVEPASTRQVVAGPDGLSYVIVGAEIPVP